MKKLAKKQARQKSAKQHRKQERVTRRQAQLRARDELLHDMRPLLVQHNLRGATDEAWTDFAAQVMHDSIAVYDEPEFSGLLFRPAEALYSVLDQFNARVPPPDELEKLPEEEQSDITTEAYVNVIAQFISPEFQHAVLGALVACRDRLRREKQTDTLALTSALEMILRDDDRPLVWGTCGMLFQVLQASLEEANRFEEAREEALKAARAVQPDVTEEYDLVEGSPADLAYWQVVDETPGLADYLEDRSEMEDESMEDRRSLDGELATQLFDPEELDELLDALVQDLKAQGVDLLGTDNSQKDARTAVGRLPEFLEARIPNDRFKQLLIDLDEMIETEDEDDPRTQHAAGLRKHFAESNVPYWQNPAFQQFIFDALVTYMLEAVEESAGENDGKDDDDA